MLNRGRVALGGMFKVHFFAPWPFVFGNEETAVGSEWAAWWIDSRYNTLCIRRIISIVRLRRER